MKRPPGWEAIERLHELRRLSTDAEKRLWNRLRGRRLEGAKFRRQTWLGPFIADFVCVEARLVIEADGSEHADRMDYDRRRSAWLAREGFRVLRFWNDEIVRNDVHVLRVICAALVERLPSPSYAAAPRGPLPLPERERGE